MILVDLTQVVVSNIMVNIKYNPNEHLDENIIRHMVLDSLRNFRTQFGPDYGKLVICCDSKVYWRRKVFPFYKHNRKKDREISGLDWNLIFDTISKIKTELRDTFPYKVIEVEGAEADDIIAVLGKQLSKTEKVLILSSDKDFVQLQKYPNITQYSPLLKRYVNVQDPRAFIKEQIIRGDRGDGIPNILSADNVFAIGERQKSITKIKLEQWVHQDSSVFCTTPVMERAYERNRLLIDLDFIPEELQDAIEAEYALALTKNNPKTKIFDYFVHHKLKHLMEHINDF